jgi:Replication initiation/membrane attachment protein
LNTLLYRSLGEVDYEKTRFYFSCPQIDEKKYRNITRRFDEVFHVDLDNEHLVLAKDQFGQDIQKEPQVAYDLEMFYRGLQDYQIPLSAITKEVEKAICQYGTIYHIAPTIMRELIYDVYDHHQIIIEDLQKRCLRYYEFEKQVQPKEVYAKHPKPNHNQPAKNKREEKIRQIASLSPYEYLCALQNGSAPTARDLSLIENLLTKQQLPSGVVNVLIETVLRMNHGQLPRNHLEYLAGTFARKKIDTVEKAIEEAKVYMASKKNLDVQIEKPKVQEISKVEKEEYEALRKEIEMMLKGG